MDRQEVTIGLLTAGFTLALILIVLGLAPARFRVGIDVGALTDRKRGPMARLAADLDRAGLFDKTPTVVAASLLLAALLIGAMAALILGPIASVLGPIVVWSSFRFYLHRREASFLSRTLEELPSFLNQIAAVVQAGAPPVQGYRQAVIQNGLDKGCLSRYLSPSLADLASGVTFADALEATREFIPIRAWEMFVSQISLHAQAGGDIAEALSTSVKQITRQVELQAQARAKTAGIRMQQRLIIGIVAGGLAIFSQMNKEGIVLLVTSPMGYVFLITGLGLVAGALKLSSSRLRMIDRRLTQ